MSQYLIVGKPELTRSLLRQKLGDLLDTAYDLNQIVDWPEDPQPGSALPPLKAGDEGIDLSHYQDMDIVWEAVGGAKKFAICKATEGLLTDSRFNEHFRQSFGFLRRGVYCFYRIDLEQPLAQAHAFLEAVARTGLKPDMGPGVAGWWVDFETPLDSAGHEIDLLFYRPNMASNLTAFFKTLLADGGLLPSDLGLYTRRSFFNLWLPQTADKSAFGAFIGQFDLWAAGYPFTWPNPAYKVGLPWPWEQPGLAVKPARLHQYDNGAMSWSQVVPGMYTKKVDKSTLLNLRSSV